MTNRSREPSFTLVMLGIAGTMALVWESSASMA